MIDDEEPPKQRARTCRRCMHTAIRTRGRSNLADQASDPGMSGTGCCPASGAPARPSWCSIWRPR